MRLVRDLALLALTRPDKLVACGCWWLVGKRVRARYRLAAAIARLPRACQLWMSDAGKDDLRAINRLVRSKGRPTIGVHVHVVRGASAQSVKEALDSVLRQSTNPDAVLVTAEDPRDIVSLEYGASVMVLRDQFVSRSLAMLAALEAAREMQLLYLVPLSIGADLPRHALTAYAAHLLSRDADQPMPAVLFGDELMVAGAWHRQTWLKPEWDARMIWSQDYITGACLLEVDAALEAVSLGGHGVPNSVYEWILRMAAGTPSLEGEHVVRVTARTAADSWQKDGLERLADVERTCPPGVRVSPGPFGTVLMQYPMPRPAPKVSIIVATRDRVELLRSCTQGVLVHTAYPDFELIVADNDSREPETLRYMEEIADDRRVRVVRWPHAFNYSAINNFAAGHATGEYLCLLNNDIEVLEPQWLDEMVREAVQPGIGVVGARLLYPDRTIQHAGVVIGVGNAAGHAHRGLPVDEVGYFAQTHVVRGVSAVTGACLLVAKRDFDAVGGFDEAKLAIAYNDVDLCLKLRQRGLANIYTPLATLIHHESKSRGLDFAPEHRDRYMRELAAFQERWGAAELVDPWHHRQLDRQSEVFR